MPLEDAGVDTSVLADGRGRVSEGHAEHMLFDTLLEQGKARGWLKKGGQQRTDSTHVLASVGSLSPVETVGETLRAAVEDLADADPDWLVAHIRAE